MKVNMPITESERLLNEGTMLVTTTDLKGAITSTNSSFVEISGYGEDELMGANHNIVRHPHMPKEAFGNLWDTLKKGIPWNGLVKNRAKNGDHYWVDAFVAPILSNGEVVGYQSVRTQPSRERVNRAEQLYSKIREGSIPWFLKFRPLFRHKLALSLILMLLLPVLLSVQTLSPQQIFTNLMFTTPVGIIIYFWLLKPITRMEKAAREIVDNPLMDYLYTGSADEFGTMENAIVMLKAKLRTVLGRIGEYGEELSAAAEKTNSAVKRTNSAVMSQKEELDSVATTMNELNATAHEVASNVVRTADASQNADNKAHDGAETITHAIGVIETLANNVRAATSEMEQLDQYSEEIGSVLDVIRSIAEQTNLLALNAAIEAARAGEQGRGFAVVADEVRVLASRTADSTADIQTMIERLQGGTRSVVAAIKESENLANKSEEEIERTAEAIAVITGEVSEISDQNTQVASAAEEQTHAIEEVERNIININVAAEETTQTVSELSTISDGFANMACQLRVLVNQCRT